MTCCKAEEYGWCNGLDTIAAPDGFEYCIFHAPTECPEKNGKININKFNEQVYNHIDQTKDNELCYLSGTIFPGDISFSKYKEIGLPSISFTEAMFHGVASFSYIKFNGDCSFNNSEFYNLVDFSNSIFVNELTSLDFSAATFKDYFLFAGATVNSESYFFSTEFENFVDFSEVIFFDEVHYNYSKFHKESYFWKVDFIRETSFDEARFSGQASFIETNFWENISFYKATFDKITLFKDIIFHKDAQFNNSSFFDYTEFDSAIFNEKVEFVMCHAERYMHFARIDLFNASFLQTPMRNIHFEACCWSRFAGRFNNKGRYYVQNEKIPHLLEQVEEFYRKMKEKYKSEGNEGEASWWHYSEKEAHRKGLKIIKSPLPWIIHNLYWISSGYSEIPERALGVLVILILLLGMGMIIGGVFWKTAILATVQHTLFLKDPVFIPKSGFAILFVAILSKLLIPIQAAFLALALRNRFRR